MRLVVAGTRTFNDKALLCKTLDLLTSRLDKKKLALITGGCRGADSIAIDWAFHKGVSATHIFHPDWEAYGEKKAGPIRNSEMIRFAGPRGVVVAFWEGTSPGTKDLINKARKARLKVRIIRYDRVKKGPAP